MAIKQNDPDALVDRMMSSGLDASVRLSRRAGREHLYILGATKPLTNAPE